MIISELNQLQFLAVDYNLLSCKADNSTFTVLVLTHFYVNAKINMQNTFTVLSKFFMRNRK